MQLSTTGLVLAEQGRPREAPDAFAEALARFDGQGLTGRAAAAARELGGAQLAAGDVPVAVETLERAVALAGRSGDQPGLGAAANTLGLAHLAGGGAGAAAAAFQAAAAAHPRGVRPDEYAMAKANLALAYERAGDAARASLAATQALGIGPAPPPPVAAQAAAVLDRLGGAQPDLLAVLNDEPADRWPTVLREEVARCLDDDPQGRRAALGVWIDGQLARKGRGADLAAAWLAVLLERSPEQLERIAADALGELATGDAPARDRFRTDVGRAMLRLHEPQRLRLKDTFDRVGAGEAAGAGPQRPKRHPGEPLHAVAQRRVGRRVVGEQAGVQLGAFRGRRYGPPCGRA
ncbi:MAG TPA: hypothetical protein VM324_03290 [Egibacteraceae bacterium]|nr:hypothetical protein [Egibacteraceae bacterium]